MLAINCSWQLPMFKNKRETHFCLDYSPQSLFLVCFTFGLSINNKLPYWSNKIKRKATPHLLHAISTHFADEENLLCICCPLKHEFFHSY